MTDPREMLMLKLMRAVVRLRLHKIFRFGGSTHFFIDYFKGFEKVKSVRQLFGARTEDVLRNLRVEFTWLGGYMWVNSADGHLMVSAKYLSEGDRVDVYLDVIHELVHVKQMMEGKNLFDVHYGYTERPTEIEAYRIAVKEARALGLSYEQICRYLKTEWMSEEDLKRLTEKLNVKCT